MVHDPYTVEPRKPLTTKQRLQVFLREGGVCCVCGCKIVGKEWVDEHKAPLWLNGTNDLENRGVAHVQCAREKTAGEARQRAKGRRIAEKHQGARRAARPMAGSKASPWRKRMDGTVERRR